MTKKITLDDIFEAAESEGELVSFYLPFDPLDSDGRDEGTLDLLIEHFTEIEEYEKCAKIKHYSDLLVNKKLETLI